jgi:hypothetical protein
MVDICLQNLQRITPRTMGEAMDSATPSLALIRKHGGEELAVQVVADLINDLNDFLSVKPMTVPQVAMTAEIVVQEFYWLKIADLKLVFRNAMSGKYGELYNRLDGQLICGWIRKYQDERLQEAERRSQQEHRDRMKPDNTALDNEALERLASYTKMILARLNYTPKEGEPRAHYNNLQEWADQTGRDLSEFLRTFETQWRQDWENGTTPFETAEQWIQYKKYEFLTNLNNSHES